MYTHRFNRFPCSKISSMMHIICSNENAGLWEHIFPVVRGLVPWIGPNRVLVYRCQGRTPNAQRREGDQAICDWLEFVAVGTTKNPLTYYILNVGMEEGKKEKTDQPGYRHASDLALKAFVTDC